MSLVTSKNFSGSSAPTIRPPGRLASVALRRFETREGAPRSPRFVMQTHPLGGSAARPGTLLVTVAVAVALYLIGRRISD